MVLACQALAELGFGMPGSGCARNAEFALLPEKAGALQLQGWMLSILAAGQSPCPLSC